MKSNGGHLSLNQLRLVSTVDLRRCFSNQSKPLGTLISLVLRGSRSCGQHLGGARMADQRGPVVEETRQSQTRLSAPNRRELLAAYAVGVPVQELASRFGVHRATVWETARRAGLDARTPELAAETRAEAARLYEDGLTLARVAGRLGASDEAVRSAVLECGGVIRPRGRRPIRV